MGEPAVELVNVTKRFDEVIAVDNVSLRIEDQNVRSVLVSASRRKSCFTTLRSGDADLLDDPDSTEVRSQARFPRGSKRVDPPADLDVVGSHLLRDPANQMRVGRREEQNGAHPLRELREQCLCVLDGETRLLGGQNPVLRRAEAEMVDTQVGQRQGVLAMLRSEDLNPRTVLIHHVVPLVWRVLKDVSRVDGPSHGGPFGLLNLDTFPPPRGQRIHRCPETSPPASFRLGSKIPRGVVTSRLIGRFHRAGVQDKSLPFA